MVTPQQIQQWIQAGLACDHILARHQLVYQALGERMHAEIHALSMKTLTPEEWAARNG